MKRSIALVLILICALGLVGCNNRSMDYIKANEPSVTGIVEEVYDNYMIISLETDSYPSGASCEVSLAVENKDSYTSVSVGDEVVVYYNGKIAETYPLQINTVYAITLKTPTNQETD